MPLCPLQQSSPAPVASAAHELGAVIALEFPAAAACSCCDAADVGEPPTVNGGVNVMSVRRLMLCSELCHMLGVIVAVLRCFRQLAECSGSTNDDAASRA